MAGCLNLPGNIDGETWFMVSGTSFSADDTIDRTPELQISFNRPLKLSSVYERSVFLIPSLVGESCHVDLVCDVDMQCRYGRCQTSRVTKSFLTRLLKGEVDDVFPDETVPLWIYVADERTLVVTPRVALDAFRSYSLVLTDTVFDTTEQRLTVGNPELDASVYEIVAGETASKTVVSQISPALDDVDVPINLARIVIDIEHGQSSTRLSQFRLRDELGNVVELEHAVGDAKSNVSERLELFPSERLRANMVYELSLEGEDETLSSTVFDVAMPRFATNAIEDRLSPVSALETSFSDGCLIVRGVSNEIADQKLWIGTSLVFTEFAKTTLEWGAAFENATNIILSTTDLAGNSTMIARDVVYAPTPRVVISELLFNPQGIEPAQEYIELFNASTERVDITDWVLDDGLGGVAPFPATMLEPNRFALVVGAKFSPTSIHEQFTELSIVLIRLNTALTTNGLANHGERISLRDAKGVIVSSFGGYYDFSKKSYEGRSVERVSLNGCDLEANWRIHDFGGTPGKPYNSLN